MGRSSGGDVTSYDVKRMNQARATSTLMLTLAMPATTAVTVATASVSLGEGYNIALRMARRNLLNRAGLREDQVLGA